MAVAITGESGACGTPLPNLAPRLGPKGAALAIAAQSLPPRTNARNAFALASRGERLFHSWELHFWNMMNGCLEAVGGRLPALMRRCEQFVEAQAGCGVAGVDGFAVPAPCFGHIGQGAADAAGLEKIGIIGEADGGRGAGETVRGREFVKLPRRNDVALLKRAVTARHEDRRDAGTGRRCRRRTVAGRRRCGGRGGRARRRRGVG
jgi:hypothetical protein